ncbi:hypothetical protein GRI75_06190 [Altererythrobacter soli]|uniref:Uncharacterized protein n=1 Tax=Croceibacterium soli TaxID=1739690 RepID=A0A6I4UQS8_9SPHN|nr:DUF5818 domain-containing protein [Croceibacterium soli]MXP41232.1 hypothetical protein [Croceibacterium soli]
MPLGTSHVVTGIIRRREGGRFVVAVFGGGEWELEPSCHLRKYVDHPVTIEGIRSGFNRLALLRIKPADEEWPPQRSWSDRWHRLLKG